MIMGLIFRYTYGAYVKGTMKIKAGNEEQNFEDVSAS